MLRDRGVEPVILETHGGYGALFEACYQPYPFGVVLEKSSEKVDRLALQRTGWRVYECDSVIGLSGGLCRDIPFSFLDVDPYGDAWPTLNAFFDQPRAIANTLVIAVNDGLRQKLSIGAADVQTMQDMVLKYGNKIRDQYLPISRELLEDKASRVGYTVERFSGYYTGQGKNLTHWLAVLTV